MEDVHLLVDICYTFEAKYQKEVEERFAKDMAPRPGPEANLPPGVSHKLAANYYYTRDGRRSVELPLIVASSQKVIASGQEVGRQVPETIKKSKTPGPFYHYSMPQHH